MAAVVVYVLTALAALIVLLTRLRWRQDRVAGRAAVSSRWAFWHTVCGALGFVIWTIFLVAPDDTLLGGAGMGIFGLGFWWLVVIFGMLMLIRWLPSRGRHAGSSGKDRWSAGPWLSLLAHGGMLVIAIVMTWAYLMQKV
ncbi:hypothetical protein [Nocardioides sp. Iso805N]|uniref:hypothetical protein n=1 Tax=Nocardioides sp. Iso805N TaxID=1283287 RepID=UPI00037149D1|nr:hypothetical protein [Nocardioides sp. Iso805N]